jgi:hypothetical protein
MECAIFEHGTVGESGEDNYLANTEFWMILVKKISLRAAMVNKIVGAVVMQESADGTCT